MNERWRRRRVLEPWGALLLSVLLVVTLFPTANASSVGRTPGPGPINRGGGGLSADGGSDEDIGEGPEPPQLPAIVLPPLIPPDPNLVVTLLHPDRDAVQLGNPLHVYAVVENVGYRLLENATVALFEGGVPSVLIGQRNVALVDLQGAAEFWWIPMNVGDRILRAIVDPFDYVEETNETDNERSVIVQVTRDPPPGRPDLTVQSTGIDAVSDVVANGTATMNVTVWNTGDSTARFVVVEVWELERSQIVANYTIPSVVPDGEDVHTILWAVNEEGPRTLEVRADPYHAVVEHNETDNVADEGFHVRRPGELKQCTNEGDCPDLYPGNPCDDVIGDTFVIYGDLVVPAGKSVVFIDCYLRVYGNVFVSGNLRFQRSILELAAGSRNQYRVEARSGGYLSFNASQLLPFRSSYGISALALAGSRFEFIAGSLAKWLYGTPTPSVPGGLQVYTSNVRMEESRVESGWGHGLYVATGINAGTLSGNVFTRNRGAGIVFASGASATIQSSTSTFNRFGVHVTEASPALSDSGILDNTYGVYFRGRSSSTLSGNDIRGNLWGIFLFGAGEGPVPAFNGITVNDSARFGVYAFNSNLTLANSTIWRNLPQGGVGVVVEQTGGGRWFRPMISGNLVGTHHDYALVMRSVLSATVRDNDFTVSNNGTWAINSHATVTNNTWSDAYGPDPCYQYVDLHSSSNLSWNTFDPGGAACITAIRSNASTTRSRNDSFLPGSPHGLVSAVIGEQGSYVEVDNATIENANNAIVLRGAAGTVKYSHISRSPTDFWRHTAVDVSSSAAWSLVANNSLDYYRYGVVIENASATVEGNSGTQRYFPPDFSWIRPNETFTEDPDWCHVCVYGSTVNVRNNKYSGGAWGISVESYRESPLSPVLVPSHLEAYDNTFNWTGFHAIASGEAYDEVHNVFLFDVNDLTAARNHAYNVTGTAYGSVTAGNATFLNNTADGCHGNSAGYVSTWWGCLWVRNGAIAPFGHIVFRGNYANYTNYTAIRVAALARHVDVYDNAVNHVLNDWDYGIDIIINSNPPIRHPYIPRIENNTVHDARFGLWFRDGTYGYASNNTLTGNRVYGIWITNTEADPSGTMAKLTIWWNNVYGNGEEGVHIEYPTPSGKYWNATCNWWGDRNGPNDPWPGNPDTNVNPAGELVSDYFHYRDEIPPPPPQTRLWWLQSPSDQATFCHP